VKNYDIYLSRLINFAKALGIKMTWKPDIGCDGLYDPISHQVEIDNELDNDEEIATILHELGHAMDEYRVERLDQPRRMKAYTAWYDGKDTKLQRKLVIEEEIIAWKIGRLIAKQLKIPLGKWYDYNQKAGLAVYRAGNKNENY